MLRQSIIRAVRPATRSFSTSLRIMASGDTGSVRPGGVAQGDAFSKREKANEDYTIRQREHEKLLELKKKLADQHENLNKLQKSIDEITEKQAAEKKN